jgi:hypothetical protein
MDIIIAGMVSRWMLFGYAIHAMRQNTQDI